MRVFISWSGERSKVVARALREWLPLVLHYVEPWLSEADIQAGDRWAHSVAGELAASNFGIVCVTSENADSPWVLFEAGALAKSLDAGKVIPLLVDLDFLELTGPLAQFQAKKLARDGMTEVVRSLQLSAADPIPVEREEKLIDLSWPMLERIVAEIPSRAARSRPRRPQGEVLEELVAIVRALDGRVGDYEALSVDLPPRAVGAATLDARGVALIMEMQRRLSEGLSDPVGPLVLASSIRERAPWLYEASVGLYRSMSGYGPDPHLAMHRFITLVESTLAGPFQELLGVDARTSALLEHEFSRYAKHFATTLVRAAESSTSSE